MTTMPRPRLRWYQFTIRSLLVLTALVAIGSSWFVVKKQKADRQRAAVRAIEAMGGQVFYDCQGGIAHTYNPIWLRAWLGDDFFGQVTDAYFFDSDVTDDGLEYIGQLAQLKVLVFHNAKISDAGLEHLKGLTQLTLLRLCNTQVTDEGIKELQQALNCQIERVNGLNQVEALYLDNSQVTDAGLESLKGFTKLRLLHIHNTKVTDEGVKKLQEALPNCQIER
jgi:hypothetical protein